MDNQEKFLKYTTEILTSRSVYGGRVIPRISHYVSKDQGKLYNDIMDYLVMLDISGMYVYIMKIFDFPFDKSRYATKNELDKYNDLIQKQKYNELLKILPEFYIADVDCQPNEYDLEPSIGRHENKKLIWDCKRRTDAYNSIDIQLLLRNRGHLYEIKKMLIWDKKAKIFEKWMNKTLEIKDDGEKLNNIKKGSGEALRSFGKGLGNSAYGQSIKKDHDDTIQFINNINDKNKYMEENILSDIIFNEEEEEDSYHVFVGKKISDETKDLSSRSRFLGSFVLSYSRVLLDNIINCIYGEDRFNISGLKKQIYNGDTDSIIIHCSLVQKLKDNNFIGTENGKLTDDLNKNFLINGYAKITKCCNAAPKKYALKYILPDNTINEKIKCNGISQDNMKFINPITGLETNKLTYDIFEYMYLNQNKEKCSFKMPDKLQKINIKRTIKQKLDKIPLFSIHSTSLERQIFTEPYKGRHMLEFPFSVPHGSKYCE